MNIKFYNHKLYLNRPSKTSQPECIMDEIIDIYKAKITSAIRELVNEHIILIGNDNMILSGASTTPNGIINRINISINAIVIPIYLSIIRGGTYVRININLMKNGERTNRTTLVLARLERENDSDSLRLREISYRIERGDIPKNYRYWWENNNASLSAMHHDYGIKLRNETISIERQQQALPESITEAIQLEDNEILLSYVKFQARSIIIRCADWILYQAYINNGHIDTTNRQNQKIRSEIFTNWEWPNNGTENEIKKITGNYITPFKLKEVCEQKNLYYTHDVYQIISTSINMGQHLILTGPPGCGKSRLAEVVGSMLNGNPPKIVTASPSWTSGDVIGRYFPRLGDGKLRFHPGVFLQASEENQCLIIDEMNRANIDECMGELFTILAGQSVDLPYMDTIDDIDVIDETDDVANSNEKYGHIKIVPDGCTSQTDSDRAIYRIKSGFRLIGTMNDSDRSTLHNLSFALLRRFNVVKIKPPENIGTRTIIKNLINSIELNFFPTFRMGADLDQTETKNLIEKYIENISMEIFQPNNISFSLINNNVAGIAILIEVIEFCLGALNSNNYCVNNILGKISIREIAGNHENNANQTIECLIRSLFSLGLTMKIIPQLDAVDDNIFEKTVYHIKQKLDNEISLPYCQVTQDNNPTLFKMTPTHHERISHYFLEKVKNHYQGTIRASLVQEIINGSAVH